MTTFTEFLKRRTIYDLSGGKCHICQQPVDFDEFVKDHVYPDSRGGSDSPFTNLRAAHMICNISETERSIDTLAGDGFSFMDLPVDLPQIYTNMLNFKPLREFMGPR